MDDADLTDIRQERELEAAIKAARGITPTRRTHCKLCAEPLAPHRVRWGSCFLCQMREEARHRWHEYRA